MQHQVTNRPILQCTPIRSRTWRGLLLSITTKTFILPSPISIGMGTPAIPRKINTKTRPRMQLRRPMFRIIITLMPQTNGITSLMLNGTRLSRPLRHLRMRLTRNILLQRHRLNLRTIGKNTQFSLRRVNTSIDRLRALGGNGNFLRTIQNLFKNTRRCVRTGVNGTYHLNYHCNTNRFPTTNATPRNRPFPVRNTLRASTRPISSHHYMLLRVPNRILKKITLCNSLHHQIGNGIVPRHLRGTNRRL